MDSMKQIKRIMRGWVTIDIGGQRIRGVLWKNGNSYKTWTIRQNTCKDLEGRTFQAEEIITKHMCCET